MANVGSTGLTLGPLRSTCSYVEVNYLPSRYPARGGQVPNQPPLPHLPPLFQSTCNAARAEWPTLWFPLLQVVERKKKIAVAPAAACFTYLLLALHVHFGPLWKSTLGQQSPLDLLDPLSVFLPQSPSTFDRPSCQEICHPASIKPQTDRQELKTDRNMAWGKSGSRQPSTLG